MQEDMHYIENDFLRIGVKNSGAELTAIFHKKTGLEYLWQAGKEWPKQAPLLFPFVGQLKNNMFYFKNKTYSSERHGFARTKTFKMDNHDEEHITFSLTDDEETIRVYPFHFRLSVCYALLENTLTVTYTVYNTGRESMYFSIGAHPAFKIPLHPFECYEDYELVFEKNETPVRYALHNGLIGDQTEVVPLKENKLPLTKALFYSDALVFKNLQSELISIKSRKSTNGLHFLFSGYPCFGIWAARDADFVCLEPWHGITDHVDHTQELEKKEGIISLDPGKYFSCFYSIVPF